MRTKFTSRFAGLVLTVFASIFLGATMSIATPTLHKNGKIAFTSDRDGNQEIYIMNDDGTNQIRLTNNSLVDDFPTWSPDGTKIAFLSQKTSGGSAIFLMNWDGTSKEELTPVNLTPNHWSMTWSPDATEIAFQDDRNVYIVNVVSHVRRFLTAGSEPAWSPDGAKILFSIKISSGSGLPATPLHTINPDGTNLQPIERLGEGWTYDVDSSWSPTGGAIVFRVVDFANEDVISTARADGSGRRQVYDQYALGINQPAKPDWSPDGNKIVFDDVHFDAPATFSREIFVINIDSTGFNQLTNTIGNNFNPSWQSLVRAPSHADFDGDGRSDPSVFRPSDGVWYVNGSQTGFSATQFGLSSDQITPGDFDGDGKTDIAVWRPSTGTWYLLRSTAGFTAMQWGLSTDLPVPEDYDGDGKTDIAVWRPSTGVWYVINSSSGQTVGTQFGLDGDKPVPGDYDGDGKTDLAVYRPSSGVWFLNRSSLGLTGVPFGISTDKVVPADYDGDGRTDIAVYRDGTWYLQQSSLGFAAMTFGFPTDVPVPADYDGDGRTDAAVFRNGIWYSLRSTTGFSAMSFGFASDTPVPSAYIK